MSPVEVDTELDAGSEFPFCYACGRKLRPEEETTRDPVPAPVCFEEGDRHSPLSLLAHVECVELHAVEDEKLSRYLAYRWQQAPDPREERPEFLVPDPVGEPVEGLVNLDILGVVRLWLHAFHAVLYHEPMPALTRFAIETPFPIVRFVDGKFTLEPTRVEQHRYQVKTLKQERAAGNLDRIRCNNGKLRYECVWDQFTNGTWVCVFCIDLYGWASLGVERMGCVGGYTLPNLGFPARATRVVKTVSEVSNKFRNDAFGE